VVAVAIPVGVLSDRLQFYIPANRLASFYISSVVLGGFSAVLTYAITLLGGEHGIAAWRWIFVSVPSPYSKFKPYSI
jgi:hypothetical protein